MIALRSITALHDASASINAGGADNHCKAIDTRVPRLSAGRQPTAPCSSVVKNRSTQIQRPTFAEAFLTERLDLVADSVSERHVQSVVRRAIEIQ